MLDSPFYCHFAQLAATDDGKQLYFTSQMLLKGAAPSSSPWPESRLYRFGPDAVTLFAERGPLAPESSSSSSDGVSDPSVSGDGSLVAFTFNDVCSTIPDCVDITNEAELRGSQTLDLGPGTAQLSKNGRWVLIALYDSNVSIFSDPWTYALLDLTTGQRMSVPYAPYDPAMSSYGGLSPYSLASNGTVLIYSIVTDASTGAKALVYSLWKQGKVTPIQSTPGASFVPTALSDDASTIIGYRYSPYQNQIVAMDLASGKATVVFQPKDSTQNPVFMAASNNGGRVVYRIGASPYGNGPAYVWDSASGATIPVPLADGELSTDGTLSGAGDFAFLVTTHSRIVKFSVLAGTASALFPGTPYCDDPGAVAAGSMVPLKCSFTASLAALQSQVLYEDQPLPVLYANPGAIGIQIPWQWDDFTPPTLSLNVPSDSPFQASQPLNVWEGAPALIPADPGESSLFGIKIVKGDWSGLVTSPPGPGDIVYIYMTGLGPPQAPEEDGVPASPSKVNPIQWDLSCQFLPQTEPAQLLFAGMAPGMIGIYQTAFRVPSDAGAGPINGLSCSLASPSMSVAFGPGTPAPGMCGYCSVWTIGLSSEQRPVPK
jgi:uncharacterized protein (TIGR03437 family)